MSKYCICMIYLPVDASQSKIEKKVVFFCQTTDIQHYLLSISNSNILFDFCLSVSGKFITMSNNQRDDHHYDSRQMVPQSARSKSSSNSSTHKGFTFDPMKNMHLWTMWRIGNTEKIVNFTKHRESEVYLHNELQHGIFSGVPYGSPTLLVPPLASNINVTEATKRRATEMMHSNEGDSVLKAGQFIYFGLPRVALKNGKSQIAP